MLVMLDLGLSVLKKKSKAIERIAEGTPVILVHHGKLLEQNLEKTHVTHDDILQTARQLRGLERMDQIEYAVLENSGGISIIPKAPNIEGMLDRRIEEALQRALKNNQGPPKGP